MSIVGAISMAMLVAAAGLALLRAIAPGTIADRGIALDMTIALIVSGLAVAVAVTGDGIYVDLALVVGLLGFLATATVARYVGSRGL